MRATELTATFVRLPSATNMTLTGKNAPESSPPTLNSNEPDRSSAVMRAMDQSSECVVGLTDHSPACDETVGYDPALNAAR